MEFGLLGDVEVRVGGRVVDVGHARQRCVLAALLMDVNRPVPVDVLVDRAWGAQVPLRARNAVAGYVSRLRQVVPVARRQGGYVLTVDPLAVDVHRFDHLVAQARAADDPDAAADLLTGALALWRGEPFATLDTPWLTGVRSSLEARRLAALLDRNDLVLEQGRHSELLAELDATAAELPLDERLAGQLMLALYRSGRQADALLRYEQVRLRLADELGADPGPDLRLLHKQILTADQALTGAARPERPERPARLVPRQLPAPPRSFSGRDRELAALDAILPAAGTSLDAMAVCAVSGTAGVGKTALAVHWAHRVAARFPDGQLYVNLRGFDPGRRRCRRPRRSAASSTRSACRRDAVPAGAGRAGRPVPQPAGRPADAGRAGQRPRRRPGPAAAARQSRLRWCVVTSRDQPHRPGRRRRRPPGRPRPAVRRRGPRAARRPPRRGTGRRRTRRGATRSSAGVRGCRWRWRSSPPGPRRTRFPLAALATELRDARRLARRVRRRRPRPPTSARCSPGPTARSARRPRGCSGCSACIPARTSPRRPRRASPAVPRGVTAAARRADPGAPAHRAHSRPVRLPRPAPRLRRRAGPRTTRQRPARRHRHRLLDHYLHTAHAAARLLNPHRDPITLAPPRRRVPRRRTSPTTRQALAWFTAEHRVLLAAVDHAAATGFDTHAWQLAWTMVEFLDWQGHWHDLAATQRTAPGRRPAPGRPAGAGATPTATSPAPTHELGPPRRRARASRAGPRTCSRALGDLGRQARTHRELALRVRTAGPPRQGAATTPAGPGAVPGGRPPTSARPSALNAVGWYHAQLGDHEQALRHCEQALGLLQRARRPRRRGHHVGQPRLRPPPPRPPREAIACYRRALDLYRDLGDRY